MTYSEAENAINNIKKEVESFRGALNSFVGQLSSFASSVSQIDYEPILHEQLINNISNVFGNMNSDLKSITIACTDTFNTLVSDANKRIIEIVDSYNNSIRNKEMEHKHYLSYVTLNSESFTSPSITNIN